MQKSDEHPLLQHHYWKSRQCLLLPMPFREQLPSLFVGGNLVSLSKKLHGVLASGQTQVEGGFQESSSQCVVRQFPTRAIDIHIPACALEAPE
jgi:hypothetical protein